MPRWLLCWLTTDATTDDDGQKQNGPVLNSQLRYLSQTSMRRRPTQRLFPKAAAKDRRDLFDDGDGGSDDRPVRQVLLVDADEMFSKDPDPSKQQNDHELSDEETNMYDPSQQQNDQQRQLTTISPPNASDCNALQLSVDAFLHDARALICSPEMSRLANSSCHLLTTAAGTALHVSLLPVTVPLHVAQLATSAAVHVVGGSVDLVGAIVNNTVPLAIGVTENIASSVVGMILPMLGFQSGGQSSSSEDSCSVTPTSRHRGSRPRLALSGGEKTCEVSDSDSTSSSAASSSQEDLTMFYSFSPGNSNDNGDNDGRMEKSPSASATSSRASSPSQSPRKLRRTVSSFMRICDLQLNSHCLEIRPDLPLLDGCSSSAIDALTARGFALATYDTNILSGSGVSGNNNPPLPRWQPEGSTVKHLKRASESDANFVRILEKEVLLWHGKMDSSVQYGKGVPMFKSRGIVNMDPKAFTELLLDSDRIQTYNQYSGGRTDKIVLQRGIESYSENFGRGETKIVRSENKIPFASKSVILWNLMHGRRLGGCDEGYIIVSRSVSRTGCGAQDQVSEIVWGVNVLRTVDGHPGKTDLICVSQVGQSMVPGFVQHKLALAALCEVYKNTRALCK